MTNRHKPFAVFDIDGTLMRWQMLHATFDRLGRAGHLLEGDYDAFLAAREQWKARASEDGFREYERKLVEIVNRNLKDIAPAHFQAAADDAFAKYKDQTYRYTRDLIRELKAQNYCILAVSGVPQEMAEALTAHFGFDDISATIHHIKDGRYTGEITVAPHRKPELLQELVAKHNLTFAGSVGVGDSEGDIGMLSLVEHPIAFNPTKQLFLHAQQQGWKVVVERKTMIYEFEPADGHYRLAQTNA